MNVKELGGDKWESRRKWAEYRRHVQENPEATAEDDALRKAYRLISQGKRVLAINQVLATAGTTLRADGGPLPKLAIARAHWPRCRFGYEWPSLCGVFYCGIFKDRTRGAKFHRLPLDQGILPPPRSWDRGARDRFFIESIVPPIPPQYRPARAHLKGYVILFEPKWDAIPDPDPLLLRPLGAGLYLVVAAWDMTELERAVLFGK